MLYTYYGYEFGWIATNHPGRPSASMGTAVAASTNTYGPWTQLLPASSASLPIWGINVTINANNVNASARDTLVNIGASPPGAGGYSVVIPHLLGSCAGQMTLGGVSYYFPLGLPASTALAAQVSINSASLGNAYVYITVYGQPRNPEMTWRGSYVIAVGASPASSAGTAITSGTTSKGAWTSLGSAASPARHWQIGFGTNDATMTALVYGVDLGAGSPQTIVIQNQIVIATAAEILSKPVQAAWYPVATNTVMYARAQCSGTPDSGLSVIAYGVG